MDAVETVLLERERLVFVEEGSTTDADVAPLESGLAGLGFVLSAELHAALRTLEAARLAALHDQLLALLAHQLGADRAHIPLFRRFPDTTPDDTHELYVRRVFSFLAQEPEQPCVLCGTVGTVAPVSPCAHLICHACWDGSDYSACPICRRRIDVDDPFLVWNEGEPTGGGLLARLRRRAGAVRDAVQPVVAPEVLGVTGARLTRLRLGASVEEARAGLCARLLARTSPLPPADVETLKIVMPRDPDPALLPDRIGVRETMATVVGAMLARDGAAAAPVVAAHAATATDLLRIAGVALGGDGALLGLPPRRSLPRAHRRVLLDRLDALAPERAVEDVLRHRELWKRVGRGLHPFEDAARHPRAALAFAVLRERALDPATPFGRVVLEAAEAAPGVEIEAGVPRYRSHASRVEAALAAGDAAAAVALLRDRPGDLLRRLDHLLRLAPAAVPVALVEGAAARAATPILLTLTAHLRRRHTPWPARVFFPKGDLTLLWARPDDRAPLPPDVTLPYVDALERELLRRAAKAPRFAHAVVDSDLRDVIVPTGERSSSKTLIDVPRGSVLPLPVEDGPLRLFLHWTESDRRVDLDLSVAFFDADWRFAGLCDYTNMTFRDRAAVHSGDLTSAPPPLGAAEYVDLDADGLRAAGVRHLVQVVFSYNDVAFTDMSDAFAGFMAAPRKRGTPFDPAAVHQRFDLTGRARIAIPLVADLEARTLRWVDVKMTSHGQLHDIGAYRGGLARIGRDLAVAFDQRMDLFELACLHAAARCESIDVRSRDGGCARFVRREAETPPEFLRRLGRGDGGLPAASAPDGPWLAALLDDDPRLPEGSAVHALRGGLPFADLVAALG